MAVRGIRWAGAVSVCKIQMGGCMGSGGPKQADTIAKVAGQAGGEVVNKEEVYILRLIFQDLAQRIEEGRMNLENFLLFFHKNGYWGERLFQEFDYDETDLISEDEFIRGIAKIFKSSEKDKISLLFKFFSKVTRDKDSKEQGVVFNDFLTMLYNYPKEDLRQILNDKEFIEYELKNHLVPVKKEGGNACYSLESHTNVRQYLPSAPSNANQRLANKIPGLLKPEERGQMEQSRESRGEGPELGEMPSMIGKEIAKNLQKLKGKKETVIKLQYEGKELDIKTINIQQLVKKLAQKIFKDAKCDVKRGRLNFLQFENWITTHKALYENYYDGFHNQVWETDPQTNKPKYLSIKCEKMSDAKARYEEKLVDVKLFLHHSIMAVCQAGCPEHPFKVICLEGLAVKRIFETDGGFGIEVSHRDEHYTEKKFFFRNEELLVEWMQLLRFYKGESVQTRYQIGEKIGTGKFSLVYECIGVEDKQQYAIKEIPTFKLQPQSKNLIAHESSIMQTVSHPLLLEFRESIQTKTHIYIITELVKGKDLYEFVKDYDYLDEYDAAKICQQVIVGVRVLHSFEIVHRDLKPENIMIVLDKDGREVENIKIIDFGFSNYLSKLLEKRESEDLLAGTPNYIAPEILNEAEFDFKIDNFAIGVILYFMLTGALPFNDYTITEILQNTIEGTYKWGDQVSVSEEAKDLVSLLIKNDPKERITLEAALEHKWFKILDQPRKSQRKEVIRKTRSKYASIL